MLALSVAILMQSQAVLDHSFFARTLLFNVLQLSIATLLVSGFGRVDLPDKATKGVRAISKWSYSLYLVNWPVILVIHSRWPLEPDVTWATIACAALWVSICLGLSAALYHYFERPMLSWRDRTVLAAA
jgi:peptidoglycan/LPS O-acetylase OafA/YrhL